MSQYSELMGSFIRRGSFPLEADYIFQTEEALKEFYNLPENQAILHKGLLKIVEDDGTGLQALYWVAKKQTNSELEFKKLISYSSFEDLKNVIEKLEQEIEDRKKADDAIYGSTDYTLVPEDLNSLLEIANAINNLKEQIKDLEELPETLKELLKATVGTDQDDIIAYLQTLDYKSLTELSNKLHEFLTQRLPDTPTIDTLPEIQDFLEGFTDLDTLQAILDKLAADIMGDPLPTEPFRTLRGIEDFVRKFKSDTENREDNLLTELDQTLVGVGLSQDGSYSPDKETYYLKEATSVMNALKILDSLINEAINNCNLQIEDTNTVDLDLLKTETLTLLKANVKISTEQGNGIQAKLDGLFYKLTTEYTNGVLTVKVNDNVIAVHDIGLSTIVNRAEYDPDLEAIVIEFELHDGKQQVITIPVGTLIREWTIDNTYPNKVVELYKEEVLGGAPDKLSADVRLYVDKYQILQKLGNSLYVKGTTDNLTHKDLNLSDVIDSIQGNTSDLSELLLQEVDRATAAELTITENLNNEIERATAKEAQITDNLNNHINDYNNPHKVTKEQVGLGNVTNDAQVKRDEMGLPSGVATLDDNGKIPVSQMPGEIDEVIGIDHFVATKSEIPSHLTVGDKYYVEDEAKIFTAVTDSSLDDGVTPEKGIIYSNRDLNTIYRWDGKELVEVGNPIHLGEVAGTAYPGNKGKETTDNLNAHLVDYNNPHKVTKDLVGLDLVDNTSDANKPVSTALQEAIDAAKTEVTDLIDLTNENLLDHIKDKNNPHEVTKAQVGLDKVENIAPSDMPVSIAMRLELIKKADIEVVEGKLAEKAPIDSPIFKGVPQIENAPELGDNSNRIPTTNWVINTIEGNVGSNLSDHIHDYNNPHRVTAELIGLGNVDNTSDLDKPISNATQAALDKINRDLGSLTNSIGQPNGIATLGPDGKIPENLIPSSLNDVVEANNKDEFPQTGELDKIYIDKGTNLIYRWTGSQYVELSKSIELGENAGLAYPGDKGKLLSNNLNSHITDYNNPHKVTAELVNAYTKEKTQALLDGKADLVDGKIPADLLPIGAANAVHFEGSWDASTNSPTLQPTQPDKNGTGYLVSTNGSFNGVEYSKGDIILNIGGEWIKIDNTESVTSVNGKKGDVVITIQDIENLLNILDSKADASNTYTKEEVDNVINETETSISDNLELVSQEITNLQETVNNKADLVDGVIPEDLLPESVKGCVKYKGEWDANNNNPALSNTDSGKEGWYYIVSEEGRQFSANFKVGDWVVNSGGRWTKVNNADAVSSVNGLTGNVNITIDDIPGLKDAINAGGSGLEDHITDYNNPHKVTKDLLGLGKVENYSPAEMPISNAVQTEITRLDNAISLAGTDLSAHIKDFNNPHLVTKAQVGLDKVDNTTDLEKPISMALLAEFNRVDRELDLKALQSDLQSHIMNYDNPHRVTKAQIGLDKVDNTSDLEKPISTATLEALNEIKLDMTSFATKESLTDHINDRMNPHQVTAEQVGLGNVDNTADLDKPISTATLRALDNKADIHHTHTMADITDLENLPIIKGFVDSLAELPEEATGGDKYIISTQVGSGSTRYTLAEFDGSTSTWKLKLLTTGNVASVIGGDVYKLTADGIQRVLDADDYKYFYDKIWGETLNLIESIEWDESTEDKIRLKITSKKTYAAPNTNEATQPIVTPKVTYIDIEKERFLSSVYSRPATLEDVNDGYASKVGTPVLVVELTTGDEVVIDLTDTLNIYEPVDTSSIDMSVSDWTGDAATSYKISAVLRIAENSDAVKLVDSNSNGVYARLDKKNTNSILLVDDGSLSANLVIDNATNNASDIALSIGSAGLSAKFVWGDYE